MLLFASATLLLYIYDWWRLRCSFMPHSWCCAFFLLALMLLCFFSPMFINRESSCIARFWMQFCWCFLAWTFWLAIAFLAMDVLNLAVALLSHCINREHFLFPLIPDIVKGCIALGLILCATAWGVVEAGRIHLNRISITSAAAPAEGYRIALISDMHIGAACSWRNLNRAIAMLEELHPNLILSAGDLIDGVGQKEEQMASALADRLTAPKIAVYGNHDVYSGLKYSRRLHDTAGFRLLENEAAMIDEWLVVYGETDPANGGALQIPRAEEGKCSILLKHRPVAHVNGGYALQLSGHSHGGQIFPFNMLVRRRHPYKEGVLHRLSDDTLLYVSRGTGVWGPPFRLFAPPEITEITIQREENNR